MRPPKSKDRQQDDRQPPGGRAWRRVQEFARQRGLPTAETPAPHGERGDSQKPKGGSRTKR